MLREAEPLLLRVGDGFATEQRWLRRKWRRRPRDRPRRPGRGGRRRAAGRAAAPPSLDDLAYVIFTSGSTGRPKGVMIEQRGMVNNMRSKFEPLGLGADDVIAQTASPCFDISVWQFLGALLLGAQVLIVDDEITRDPPALLDHLAAHGATVWSRCRRCCRPRSIVRVRSKPALGDADRRGAVAPSWSRAGSRGYPGIALMNAYGPAECSDDVALQALHAPVERRA